MNLNLIPTDLVDGKGISGHWGAITLAPSNLTGGAANTALQATLANIPPEVCTQLAPQLMGYADELDIEKATVKSQTNPKPDRDAVAGACITKSGGNVSIVIRAS